MSASNQSQLEHGPNLARFFFHFFISFVFHNLPLFLIISWFSFAAGSPYTFDAVLSVNWQCFFAYCSLMGFHKFMLSIFRWFLLKLGGGPLGKILLSSRNFLHRCCPKLLLDLESLFMAGLESRSSISLSVMPESIDLWDSSTAEASSLMIPSSFCSSWCGSLSSS